MPLSMLSTSERRAQVIAAEPRWKAKFILRIIVIIFDFLSIVMAAITITTFDLLDSLNSFLLYSFIPLGISIFWCLANIIVRARRPRPMHPGANVAMDLLIWMAFFVALFFVWWILSFFISLMVLHIVLFIWSSIDTSKRNKAETQTRRAAIAEKLEAGSASQRNTSANELNTDPSQSSVNAAGELAEARPDFSNGDAASSSLGHTTSPSHSPGPSSPAPAYVNRPVSPFSDPLTGRSELAFDSIVGRSELSSEP
ncbi:MAG: hypothetical protein LQ340_007225 [Diploschistes diacapsis]|nr:MAG: hypothetical protein LQ340_007225 [Diploschistes diacapsis]